jgi:tetratricopeptide (TPR) repeat protein
MREFTTRLWAGTYDMIKARQRGVSKAILVPILGAVSLALVWGGWQWWQHSVQQKLRSDIRSAYIARRYDDVEKLMQKLCASRVARDELLILAAQAAVKDQRFADAVRWFDTISPSSPDGQEVLAQTGEIYLLSLHQLSPAETRLREALEKNPDHFLARQQLAGLLGLTGRTSEAAKHRIELIRQRRFTRVDLVLMGLRDTTLENVDQLEACQRAAPDDPLTQLAIGHYKFRNHDLVESENQLRKAIATRPQLLKAHALLGQLLLECRRFRDLPAWHRALPAEALNDAEIWTVLGDWARERGQPQGAIRCYLEAIQRDPLQQQACFQVAALLQSGNQTADAEKFRHQATRLQDLLIAVKHFHAGLDHESIRRIVSICTDLGMIWEAWAWSMAAKDVGVRADWPSKSVSELEPKLPKDASRTLVNLNPASNLNLSEFPSPDWSKLNEIRTESAPELPGEATQNASISFRDDAHRTGLTFDYFTGHDPALGVQRVFEFAGGAAGVLDYDLDGWPDLHYTQGTAWPPAPGQTLHIDQLFRNGAGGNCQNVTDSAGLVENRYSHGVSVGDWNDDGFPDLFVANAGPNRLYRNNGDGTFTDVTDETQVAGNRWTTSCAMADVNGDGWPDLYAVNYLAGDNLYERVCLNSKGQRRVCTPHDLEAAPDEFYLNLGDGRFSEQSATIGLAADSGKGLGIVVADFDQSGHLSLFVANDTDGNLFFRNVGSNSQCRFEEQAIPMGLAFDVEGRSLASMGVAAGDSNDDGRLDLFVTTYFAESSMLYVQQPDGLFIDQANGAGLRLPSLGMLGFGAQFLDADLDGHSDLVVVNGHVEKDPRPGIAHQMQPQFFRNVGNGRFEESKAQRLGDWFTRKTLGRGLSRLDWNRDGRPDFAVSHIHHPAALLTNTSGNTGNSIIVRLHGTIGNRDAIGAILQLTVAGRTITQQIVAGDGYQASNERICIFGLGQQSNATELSICWPSGTKSVIPQPRANTEYRIIEGREQHVAQQIPHVAAQ